MSEESTIRLRIPRRKFYLGLVRHVVTHLAERMGFSGDEVAQIEMSADEAVSNFIQHGTADTVEVRHREGGPDYDIDLSLKLAPDRIEIEFTDKGPSFDFDDHGGFDVEGYLSRKQVGGLGIYVMKTLMDKVEYTPNTPEGNKLRMVKRLPSS